MSTVQASHGFEVSTNGDTHHFTYTQEKYQAKNLRPMILGLSLISIVPTILLVTFFEIKSVFVGITLFVLTIVGIFRGIKYLMNLSRKEGSFSMTKNTFEVEGKSYSKKDITGIYFQEGKTEPVPSPYSNGSTIIVGNSVGNSLMATSAVNLSKGVGRSMDIAGAKLRNNIAQLNCKVLIRYGNKNIVIAKGLTIDTAELMMNKISQLN